MNYWTQSNENIYVAAHRGWSSRYPENTLLAMKEAMALGVDQLETDVRVTKDGELVLIHDATVDRTTNGTGRVCDMTLEELKALDAGGWKGPEFAGLKIPTFVEFMELVKDHPTMTLDVELKEYPVGDWEKTAYEVCGRILQIIDDYGFTDRVVLNSWSGKLNEYIFTKYGIKYRQHLYFPPKAMGELTLEPYSFGYCCCMFANDGTNVFRGIATPEECATMAQKGVRPWAGTAAKDGPSVDRAIAAGVELITCNDAKLVLDYLRSLGRHK